MEKSPAFTMEFYLTLRSLIAKMTGHDWKTVAKRIKEIEAGKEYLAKKPHPRILDYHKEQIL